jgi:cbb3-type cytochrome oxidase maturation protein
MSVIVLLIVAGGAVAAGFLLAFVWAVQSGQFDDTCTPAVRILRDDARPSPGRTGAPARDDDRTARRRSDEERCV